MKNLKVLFIGLFTFLSTLGYSQYCGTATSNVAITPTTTSQLTSSYSSGRRAFNFVATAGCIYEFSTCGQSTNDTYLRLYSTGTGGTLLAQNDDVCGLQSTLTWTATVNGTVSILLTRASCNALSIATKMSYRRISCSPPSCATLVAPTNLSVNVLRNQTLSWNSVSTATSYDVYFGTNSSPPLVTNQTGTTYNPGTLNYSTTYYWRIVPKNSNGSATGCSTWSFTTVSPGCLNAPYGQFPSSVYNPTCSGTSENITTSGYAGEYSIVGVINGVSYTFSSSIGTDFITITDDIGGVIYVYGTGSVSWTSTLNGNIRMYTHTNDFCGTSNSFRARRVQCSTPPPPSNDLCSNAVDVGCGGTFTGNTTFATTDLPDCDYNAFEGWNAPGVWYRVVGNGQTITASLCGSNYDTKLFAYTGTCGALTCLTADDDFCSLQSQISFSSTLNTTYYILVTGYGSNRGSFSLNVSIGPSPPVITTQPITQSICAGTTTTLSVANSGVQGPFTYQWYLNGNIISNLTSTTLTVSTGGNYTVVIKNFCGISVTSNVATITVNPKPDITLTSYSSTICAGGTGTNTLTSSVTSGTPTYTYQWQYFSSSWINTGTSTTTLNATPTVNRDYRVVVTDINGCKDTTLSHTVTVVPDPINPTLNTKTPNQNDVCKGINLSANFIAGSSGVGCSDLFEYSTNGTSWISYTANSNISTTNLLDGTVVQIRGRRGNCTTGIGCSNNSWVVLTSWTVRAQPTLSFTSTNVSCFSGNDGSIDLTTQGNSPYSYSWSNNSTTEDLTNLSSGNYNVTVSDNFGCQSSTSVTITQPTQISTSTTQQNAGCFGSSNGSIDLTVNGGTPNYTYSWSNGSTTQDITGLSAGTYSVTITDNKGCQKTSSVTITQDAQINLTISPSNPSTSPCSTTPVMIQASGTNSYLWSNGSTTSTIYVNPQVTTTYTVTGTTNGCSDTKTVTVNVSNNGGGGIGNVGPISGPSYVCDYIGSGLLVKYEINPVIGATGYTWSVPPNVIIYSGQGTTTLMVEFTSNYSPDSISVTAQNSCNFSTPSKLFVGINPTPSIVGDLCGTIGVNRVYRLINTDPTVSYSWTVPYGAVILSGQGNDTIVVKYSQYFNGGRITVNGTTNCGDVYAETGDINLAVGLPTITGSSLVCAGTNETYFVSPIPTAFYYQWSVPNGVTLLSGQGNDTINVSFSSTFTTGTISCMAVNTCGSSPMSYYTISNQNIGTTPGTISGPTDLCPYLGTTATYSVTNQPNVTFNWSVPTGMTVVNGQGTNVITYNVPNTFTSSQLSVSRNNGCGVSNSSTLNLTTVQNNIAVSNVTGPTNVCNYVGTTTIATYSITPVTNGQYNWLVPSGANIASGQGTNSINVTFASTYGGGTISVTVSSYCGSPVTKTITASSATYTIPPISGTKCIENGFTYTYSVLPITGALNYTWIPPGNATIVSGQGTNTVSIFYPSNFETSSCLNNLCDSLRLSVTFGCGVRNSATRIGMTVYQPTTVLGPITACGPDTITLSITPVSRANSYTWNRPNGTSFINPNNGSLITALTGNYTTVNVNVNSTFLGGNFSVMSSNQCGTSAMRYHTVNKSCSTAKLNSDTTYMEDLFDDEWKESLNKPLDFIIFPNPTEGNLEFRIFRGNDEYYLVTIFNKIGMIVYNGLKEKEDSINLTNLESGTYSIKVTDNQGNTVIRQLIIL